jgi:hypothetical protein
MLIFRLDWNSSRVGGGIDRPDCRGVRTFQSNAGLAYDLREVLLLLELHARFRRTTPAGGSGSVHVLP